MDFTNPRHTLRKLPFRRLGLVVAATSWVLSLGNAHSQTTQISRWWDTNGSTAGVGGVGNWDLSTANWNTVAAGTDPTVVWNNSSDATTGYNALFIGSGGGTVTVTEAVIANSLQFSGGGAYTLSGSTINLTKPSFGNAISIASNNTTATISNNIEFTNAVNLSITASNNILTLNGSLTKIGASGVTLTLNSGPASGITNFNGDILRAAGSGSLTITNAGGGTINLYGNNTGINNGFNTIGGNVVMFNSGALGTGTLTLTEDTNSNATSVLTGSGGLTIANNVSIAASAQTGDSRTLGGKHTSGTSTYSGTVTIQSQAQASGLQLTSAAGGTTVFSGLINDSANTVGITKVGAGTVILSRTDGNTYDGGTNVSAGTLLVNNTNNSGTGTGSVSVASGAILGGIGKISGPVVLQSGGRLTPGSNGTESLEAGSLTWNSNDSASLFYELGTASDLLTLTGSFSKGIGSSWVFDFADAGGLTPATYTLVTFASTDFLSVSDFAYTSSIGELQGNFNLTSNELQFVVTAVPESNAAILVALAGLAMISRRHRRKAVVE